MSLKVLLICGHPRRESLSSSLAEAYAEGARTAGADVRTLALADLEFAPDVVEQHINDQPREPDILAAQQGIAWAEHLVLVFPTWWGLYPARLKAFLDRVLTPGFAFTEADTPSGFTGCLGGRTAHLLTTMDTPGLVYRLLYGSPGRLALERATLGFCGVGPVRFTAFGPVKDAIESDRASWIRRAASEGRRLRGTAADWRSRAWRRLGAWLRVLRLQFYPMAWLAYAVGLSLAAAHEPLAWGPAMLGLLVLATVEAAAVLANEIADLPGDRLNRHAGPFNGGSRMLVEGRLSVAEVRIGVVVALGFAGASAAALLATVAAPLVVGAWLAGLTTLALGYSLAPLRLVARGLGEATVCLTHSLGVMAFGVLVQNQAIGDPRLWWLAVPLGLAILPAILLANVPDSAADAATGKRTLPVRLGPGRSFTAAAVAALLAWSAALVAAIAGMPGMLAVTLFSGVHALGLMRVLWRAHRDRHDTWRLNPAIATALAYLLWFVAVPLLALA